MLNPRTYMSDCIRIGKMSTWAFGLPWVAINSVIDCNTMAYEPSKTAKAAWFAFTHSPWNPLEGTDNIIITCSRCGIATERAWTTVTNSIQFTADAKSAKEGRGYADPGFIVVCKCGTVINHDTLRCSKFLADLENLTAHDVPMPGTLLSVDGIYLYSRLSQKLIVS